jgi:hypothetical protein
MADELNGKRIAFLTANEGVEEVELTEAVTEAGAKTPRGKGRKRLRRARPSRPRPWPAVAVAETAGLCDGTRNS